MSNAPTLHLDLAAVPARHHTWLGVTIKVVAALAVVGLLFLLFHFVLAPYLGPMEDAIARLGAWAPLIFIAAFLIGTSIFVPESALAIAAGAMFGLWMGLVWVVLAGTLTAIFIFWLGRKALRNRIERVLERHPKIKAVDAAASSAGFRLMVLLRLSPLNYTLLCYLLAVSRARFRPYLLACLGMFPGNLSTVYVGYAARHAADLARQVKASGGHLPAGDSLVHEITLFGGLAAAIIASVVVARVAMRAVRAAAAEAAAKAH
ncbi:MAG: VTT domain-containing protein [Phycisphaerales bacterium]|nr:VTT domain-containing protein [Phycisphaerales bacterium]